MSFGVFHGINLEKLVDVDRAFLVISGPSEQRLGQGVKSFIVCPVLELLGVEAADGG